MGHNFFCAQNGFDMTAAELSSIVSFFVGALTAIAFVLAISQRG